MDEVEAVTGMARRTKRWPDVPAGNQTDVAFEQLEYLAEHTAAGFCINGCPDCNLLIEVRILLLAKFE